MMQSFLALPFQDELLCLVTDYLCNLPKTILTILLLTEELNTHKRQYNCRVSISYYYNHLSTSVAANHERIAALDVCRLVLCSSSFRKLTSKDSV